VLASRLCPVCRKVPIHARQEVCSGRCRAARSRQRKAEARRERDAEIRALLEAALEKLREKG
jgi:predicted nucleic acid-binding Zn ribbon protein